jgi:pyruvate dehydrogenase E1 component
MDTATKPATGVAADQALLAEIAGRVLWLAVRMVDAANHDRATGDGVKTGGHQASSASLVAIMTALWFAWLRGPDRVSVKPHASPVLHAINYLLGGLDRDHLTRLRERGGLQSYPSRTKDPDRVDFSTGSVGLGAAAPLFAAVTRRYVDAHFGARPASRFISIVGDAELDEGNVWEAVADPSTHGLGNVTWIIDFNRQSLDRVIPGVRIDQWSSQFRAAGWHVVELKYGNRLSAAFAEPGGEALRAWIDAMSNEQYQSLFGLEPAAVRERFLDGAPATVATLADPLSDAELAALVTDLGGHDIGAILDALDACDAVTDRPSVLFAYTIKGHGLPIAGKPRNHSALLAADQIDALRERTHLTPDTEWDRFDPGSAAGRLAAERAAALVAPEPAHALGITLPVATGARPVRPMSTQEAFGQIVVDLARNPDVVPYLVTTAPDVATSTNLAGFINRTGVFAPDHRRDWLEDGMVRWVESPEGQHIELGISEMNLFLLLGQLGLSWDLSGQPLLPIGTVYDPFVLRGLDALVYACYSGARFLVAGTPSGVSLAPEGGAHQSTITPSVGLELPGLRLLEPAYAGALDWLLCDALGRIATEQPDRHGTGEGAFYVRLTTRPLDQGPFEAARIRLGDAVLRRGVLDGAYRLHDAGDLVRAGAPVVQLVASGAVMPEVLEAARILAAEEIAAHVVDVTSLDRLYAAWRGEIVRAVRANDIPALPGAFRAAFTLHAPIVTVHDASPHAMAWLGSALGVPAIPLGVDTFGQSGSVQDLYEIHDLVPWAIVNAAIAALALGR